ncbi:MAG: hypothetical protein ACXVEE_41490 [Polyangiales bacterium]
MGISRVCVAITIATALFQVAELFVELESEWLSLGILNLSAAALGIDAMVRGVRKRAGEGPSIRNLAPGGWTIFAAMFWIVAVPAYFLGPRRRIVEEPVEPLGVGSWCAVLVFTVLGAALVAIAS